MGARRTEQVIQDLENEVERLSAKLRAAYDMHATTVGKAEHDMEVLKRELNSAYQLSARLTSEKAALADAGTDHPDYAAQVDEQLRLLTTELKRAHEEHRKAEEKIAELQSRLDASERVATDYVASLNRLEQEYTSAKQQLQQQTSSNTAAPVAMSGDASSNDQRIARAEQRANESAARIAELEQLHAAAQERIQALAEELGQVRSTAPRKPASPVSPADADGEMAELRARIEAAEYILADYQAKLRQAEIDRDEAVRDLARVSDQLETVTLSGAGDGERHAAPVDVRLRELEQQLAEARQQKTAIETESKRIRSRLRSAETLATRYMSRINDAEAARQSVVAELDSVKSLLNAATLIERNSAPVMPEAHEKILNDANAARLRAEEEARRLAQQLVLANQLYETTKAEKSALEEAAVNVVSATDSAQPQVLQDELRALREQCDDYRVRLQNTDEERQRLEKVVVDAQRATSTLESQLATANEKCRTLGAQVATLTDELDAARRRAQQLASETDDYRRQADEQRSGREQAERALVDARQRGEALDNELHAARVQLTDIAQARDDEADARHRELNARIEDYQQQLAEYAAYRQQTGQIITAHETSRTQLENALRQAQDRVAEIEGKLPVQTDIDELRVQLTQAHAQFASERARSDEMKRAVDALTADVREAQHVADARRLALEELQRTHAAAQDRVTELEKVNVAATHERRALADARDELDRNQRRTLQKLSTAINDLSAVNAKLEQRTAAYSAAQQEHEQLTRKLSETKSRVAAYEQASAAATADAASLRADLTLARDSAATLERELLSTRQELANIRLLLAASEQKEASVRQENQRLKHEAGEAQQRYNEALSAWAEEKRALDSRALDARKSMEQLHAEKHALIEQLNKLGADRPQQSAGRAPLRLVQRPAASGTGTTARANLKVSGSDIDATGHEAAVAAEQVAATPRPQEPALKTIPVQGIEDLAAALIAILRQSSRGLLAEAARLRRFLGQ